MQNIAAAETLQASDINIAISEIAGREAAVQFDVTLGLLSGQKFKRYEPARSGTAAGS